MYNVLASKGIKLLINRHPNITNLFQKYVFKYKVLPVCDTILCVYSNDHDRNGDDYNISN